MISMEFQRLDTSDFTSSGNAERRIVDQVKILGKNLELPVIHWTGFEDGEMTFNILRGQHIIDSCIEAGVESISCWLIDWKSDEPTDEELNAIG